MQQLKTSLKNIKINIYYSKKFSGSVQKNPKVLFIYFLSDIAILLVFFNAEVKSCKLFSSINLLILIQRNISGPYHHYLDLYISLFYVKKHYSVPHHALTMTTGLQC